MLFFSILNIHKAKANSQKEFFNKRFVYYRVFLSSSDKQTNDNELKTLENVMTTAAENGYTGIVLSDLGGAYLSKTYTQQYKDYFTEIYKEAKHLNLELIPAKFSQTDPYFYDSSTAEMFPVKDTNYIVNGDGTASVENIVSNYIANSGFENVLNSATDWTVDNLGQYIFLDTETSHSNNNSVKLTYPILKDTTKNINMRVTQQQINLDPFSAYEMTFWIKTDKAQDLSQLHATLYGKKMQDGTDATVSYKVLESNTVKCPNNLDSDNACTSDWTQYTLHFNSLYNTKLELVFDKKKPDDITESGTIWIDDVNIHKTGITPSITGTNPSIIDRVSSPIIITNYNKSKTYISGKDYNVNNTGAVTVLNGSVIKAGDRLNVSWYQKADANGYPAADACLDRTFDIYKIIGNNINSLFHQPSGAMMSFDEWRVANWDPGCTNYLKLDHISAAGEYIANATSKVETILKGINSNYQLYVWNDMYDPYHNAKDPYYTVNGSMTNSWKGLSLNTIIMNWQGSQTPLDTIGNTPSYNSLKFFSDKGFKQIIAGYYNNMDTITNAKTTIDNLETKNSNFSSVDGFMYTTWTSDYSNLRAVAKEFQSVGRWPAIDLALNSDKISVVSGETITYNVTFDNTKNSTITNVLITVPVDSRLNFDSATNNGKYDANTNLITWSIPSLAVDGEFKTSYTVKAK